MKKVCVIGLGYIGLPTAALLANRGFEVHGVDVKKEIIKKINKGQIHINEPDLHTFVKAAINIGKLKADIKPTEADIFIISVPTPFNQNKQGIPTPNINYIIKATKSIAPYVKDGSLIILESTSPVGTTRKVKDILQQNGVNTQNVYIAYCPERVLPGKIIKELVENDRIVGGITPESTEKAAQFYKSFISGEVLKTDDKTAELCKLAENSFRDVNIAFANELSIICDRYGINVWELRNLVNRHPRVNMLYPGVGVGGHCIAVDPWFIVSDVGDSAKLIRTAREINNYKTEWVIEKIKNAALEFEMSEKRKPNIACMGLAFKPDVDDLRESPALYITRKLIEENFDILPVEPNIKEFSEFKIYNQKEAVEKADIIVFLVAHKEFKSATLNDKLQINKKKILDFVGLGY